MLGQLNSLETETPKSPPTPHRPHTQPLTCPKVQTGVGALLTNLRLTDQFIISFALKTKATVG